MFNLVSGRVSEVFNELAGNPNVGMVSVTGSVERGICVMELAAKNISKVSLELGGKAPAIVMDDADIEFVIVQKGYMFMKK
jgi:lactaldehyde dehydrogenase/glycolaldehyde dehydrogenase